MDLEKREKLIEVLHRNLQIWAANRDVQSKVGNYYLKKNLSSAMASSLLNKRATLEGLNDVYLCIFTSALYSSTKSRQIIPEQYFDEKTLELEKNYIRESSNEDRKIIFYNVDKISDNHYFSTKTEYSQIAYLLNNSLTGYNFKTQRDSTIILKGKQMTEIPTLDKKNLREIYEKMMTGTFTSNAISFNHQHNIGESKMEYNEADRTLTIDLRDDEMIWTIDGHHREVEMGQIIDKQPNFLGSTMVNIFNFTEEQANNFIRQEASGKKMTAEHLESRSEKRLSTTIAKDINDKNTKFNLMFGKIAESPREVTLNLDNKNMKYTTLNTISLSLESCFGINNETDDRIMLQDTKDLVADRLSEIIALKKKDFSDVAASRKNSAVTFNGTFMLYMAIIAKLNDLGYSEEKTIEERNKFSKKLAEIIKQIDFSIYNNVWKRLGIVSSNNHMTNKMDILKCDKIQKYVNDELINYAEEESI